MTAFVLTHHQSVRLSEIGYLALVIAGVWMVAAEVLGARWQRFRLTVSGALVAAAGILLIIATHWQAHR